MTASTLADYLPLLSSHLPSGLVSEPSRLQITSLLERLPADFSRYFGFECWLGSDVDRTDVQLAIYRSSQGHDALAESAWRPLQNFARAWGEAAAPFASVEHICLAFDCSGRETEPPPSVLLRTDILTSTDDALALLAILRGQALPPATEAALRRCIEEAPAFPIYVGTAMARPDAPVRIVPVLPVEEAAGFLKRVGWRGAGQVLDSIVGGISELTTHVGLTIDVGDRVAERVGVEYPNWSPSAASKHSWQSALELLVRDGLCTPAQRSACDAFPGLLHELAERDWPEVLRARDSALHRRLSVIERGVSHLKLVCDPGGAVHAKAYLYVRQRWLDLGSRDREDGE